MYDKLYSRSSHGSTTYGMSTMHAMTVTARLEWSGLFFKGNGKNFRFKSTVERDIYLEGCNLNEGMILSNVVLLIWSETKLLLEE